MKTTKRILSWLLAVAMICGMMISPLGSVDTDAANTLPFTDLAGYSWAKSGIQYVYDNGMMTGTTKTTFQPKGNLKRGDALLILYRLAGSPDVGVTGSYTDVKKSAYYSKALEWAKATGVYEGYSDGTFKAGTPITRQDFAVMLMNTCNYLDRPSAVGDKEAYKTVADYDKVSDYAVPAIRWAYSNKIMGQGSNFNPSASISRAETAVMLKRALENTSTSDDDVYSFLCMGIDYHNYCDANILVSINKTDKTITLTSIMRDTGINYVNLGYSKFNNGFRFAGPKLIVHAVEKNFGVNIDDYAFVHFDQMAKIFDQIGGLDIDVSDEEVPVLNDYANEMYRWYGVNKHLGDIKKGGSLHLDGYQLVAFCRIRYVGDADMERTDRQRRVFTKMFDKLKTYSFPKLLAFFAAALPNVSHSMTFERLHQLINMFPTLSTYTIVSNRIPQDGNFIYSSEREMLTGINFASASAFMRKMIYNE